MIIGFSAQIFRGVFLIRQMPQSLTFVTGNLSDYEEGQAIGPRPLAGFVRLAHTGVD